jgi:hypothetical protein
VREKERERERLVTLSFIAFIWLLSASMDARAFSSWITVKAAS